MTKPAATGTPKAPPPADLPGSSPALPPRTVQPLLPAPHRLAARLFVIALLLLALLALVLLR